MVNEYSDLTPVQRTMVLNAQARSVHDDVHDIVDSDPHFVIDPLTRKIIKHTEKSILILGDHNSERFTFELPRYIQGHDMTLCNEITLNYLDGTKPGVYEIDDLTASDDETVTMTWLISSNVTQEIGKIHFGITFECIREGKVTYKWQTDINSDLSVTDGLNNTNTVIAKNEDILEQWRQKLFGVSGVYEEQLRDLKSTSATEKLAIQTTGKNQVANVTNEGTEQIQAVENKGTATLATIPEDYTALNTSVNDLKDLMHMKAPAIVEEATSGTEITVNDSADGMRLQELNVYGKSWQVTTTGAQLLNIKRNFYLVIHGVEISTDNIGRVKVVGTSNGSGGRNNPISDYISLEKGVYNIFFNIKGEGLLLYLTKNNDDSVWIRLYDNKNTFEVTENGDYYLGVNQLESVVYDIELEVVISKSENVVKYEPYTGGKPSPSPEYPQEIQSAGYVLSTGKNLFDFSKLDANYGLNVKDKTIVIPAKTNNVGYYNSLKELCPNIKAGDTYVLNAKTSNPEALRVVHLVDTNIDFNFGKAFIPTEEQINDKISFYNNTDTEKENVISEIQLEKSSEATSYEPYTGGVPALYQKDIEVGVTGKNLLNEDKYYSAHKQTDGMYKVNSVKLNDIRIIFDYSMVGKTYTASCNLNCPNMVSDVLLEATIDGKKILGNTILTNKSGISKVTFTPKTTRDSIKITYGTGSDDIIFSDFQIEAGSLATSYEPYKQPQSLPITTQTGLPAIPVPSGTSGITYTDADGQAWIADEIDFARGKYIQRVWNGVFDGSEDEGWFVYGITGYEGFQIQALPENMNYRKGMSNCYIVNITNKPSIWLGSKNKYIYLSNNNFYDATLPDKGLSNWKAHLAEHPLKVMTYLDTPIETDLSEEQIQAYKAIHTNKPTTIISNDADAWMGASYAADTKIWIENKIKEISKV